MPYNVFSANGNNPLNFVSQPKGALHSYTTFPQQPVPAAGVYGTLLHLAQQ
jgi:hypothetical protein